MNLQHLVITCVLVVSARGSRLGVEFVGVGYNLLTGNPDGGASAQGGADPGLLYTRNIFDISPGDNPPEVVVAQRHSCARIRQTHVFYGTKSYQDKLSLGVKASGGVTAAIVNFAFSLSGRYAHAREETSRQHQVYLDDQAVCNLGRARFADELTRARGFSVTGNFAAAVCRLPVTYNETKYMDFLDHWGTHVTMEAELGTKDIRRYRASLSEFVEHVRKQGGAGVSLGGSYMGYGASLAVNFEKYKDSASYKQHFGEYQYSLKSGTPDLPEPIHLKVVSIDTAFNSKYWQKIDNFVQQGLCASGSDVTSLHARQVHVMKAMTNYPAYKMAHSATDPQLKIPVTWPQGTYGLMKPRSGCPGGRAHWFEGWRYEDFEDLDTHNKHSSQLHLAGSFSDNIRFDYCMKGDGQSTDYDMVWPAGDYCILKYGHCPPEFQEGWVYWNDEALGNNNKAGGTLPDGEYDKNTKIFYCCREDGLPTHPVAMPTSKPFYLIRYKRGCQHVLGMHVTEEWVESDTEDLWGHDSKGGAYPYLDGDNPRMHYCYYSPIAVTPILG